MRLRWSMSKSAELKRKRGVSFEEIVHSRAIGIKKHPRRRNQFLLFFEFEGYVWAAPFVVGEGEFFLKTLYPDRRYTKKWKNGKSL